MLRGVGQSLCSHQLVENLVIHGELDRVPRRVYPLKLNKISPRIMAALVLPNKS